MDTNTPDFRSLGLSEDITNHLRSLEFKEPTPIQQQAIPVVLKGKDVLGIAKTGSGKTAGYLLPVLERLLTSKWELSNRHITVLILVPTRELAVQVHAVWKELMAGIAGSIKSMAVYGGVSINPQMMGMQGVQLLVATPGRLLDLIDSKALSLGELKILVLDEADKMLNKDFEVELDRLLAMMPVRRQNLLFSATLSKKIDQVSRLVLHKPVIVQIASEEQPIELIQQRAFRVPLEKKGPFLRYLIKSQDLKQVLVFTSSVKSADHVADKLYKNGINAESTHSKKSNRSRLNALAAFKSGALRVLVATDLLSRGIDIEFLPHVINYDLPRSPKDFVHRIGRTGRAENPGEALTIVTPEEQPHFKVIQKKMGRWITLESIDEVNLHGF